MTLYATTATTRLDHIRANLEAIRARVGERRVLLAVKANAYGHGAVAVSRLVEETGCADWLGVATVPEALELRDAGVRLPLLKFSQALTDAEITACVEREVDLTVVDAATIDAVADAARRLGRTASVHLKVDTGMGRIGCPPADAPALARRGDARGLRMRGIFSHLPVSDTEAGRAFTEAQVAVFRATVDEVSAARGPIELVHLANSGAVLLHPDAWFSMVRPGVMAYGSYPDPTTGRTVPLLPGLEWRTVVAFVKRVAAGDAVGYGRTWIAPTDRWIATLPVGYGDGYSRLLSNRGRVLIGGLEYPLAGRVCMDQCMVDLGPADADPPVAVGEDVVLLGRVGEREVSAADLAAVMGTIPYEVTCLVGSRVTRSYVG